MTHVTYAEVVRLAEQLTPEEQAALVAHLQEVARYRQLTVEERQALFDAMVLDLEPILPHVSFRRSDWYGDDGR